MYDKFLEIKKYSITLLFVKYVLLINRLIMKKSLIKIILLAAIILLPMKSKVIAQDAKTSYTISGVVTEEGTDEPIPGATVMIKNTTYGTISDVDGKYSFSVELAQGNYQLIISFLGYTTVNKEISLGSDKNINVDVVLSTDVTKLDEIVITGASGLTTRRQLGATINSVNEEQLKSRPVNSVTEALQGQVPGAHIMRNSGNPASSISVRLRGASTLLGSSEPLYMIDGVIINADPRSSVSLGSYTQNPLVDIDMSDIESIEVLKGPAASAIYGSLASNGIIQIITKKGKKGKPSIVVNTGINFNSIVTNKPYNDSNLEWTDATHTATQPVDRYNWQDYIFDNTMGTENSVNISGGTDKTQYIVSASYLYNEGILRNTSFDRKTFKVRINQELASWLKLDAGAYYSNNKSKEIPYGNAWTGNPMVALLFGDNVIDPSADEFGNYPYVGWMSNPYEDIDLLDITQQNNRLITDIALNANPFEGFNVKYTFGYDYTASNGKFRVPYGFTADTDGAISKSNIYRGVMNSTIDFSYRYKITDKIQATTGAGYSYLYKKYESSSLGTTSVPAFDNIDVVSGDVTGSNGISEMAYWGGYIQQYFSYDNILFLTLAGRMDGASLFGKDERQQFYPKLSGSFVISDLDFWKSNIGSIANTFKLRAAWGQAGNLTVLENIAGGYVTNTNYTTGSYVGETTYYSSSTAGNANIKPERTSEIEFGFDGSFLNSRIGLEFTYYKQDISDLVINKNLSPSTGFATVVENVGTMTNKGIEIGLNAGIIKSNDFNWDLNVNYSTNENLVTHVVGGRISFGGFGTSIAQTDQPLGVFYGYFTATDANGEPILNDLGAPQRALGHYEDYTLPDGEVIQVAVQDYDANGQPTGQALKKVIGDPNPDYTISFTNTFSYKNFTFRFMIDAVQGFDVFDWDKRIAYRFPGGYYQGQEMINNNYGFYSGQYYVYDQFVEDGSFVKLRDLSLSYNWKPKTNAIKSIIFTASGSNLFTWTKYWGFDPEVNFEGASNVSRGQDFGNIPVPRVFKLGVKLTF
jgi:TonB-linked SusC/RagA family outer membrane protein